MHSWLFSTTRRLAHVGSLWLDWGSTTRWWANCTVELSGNPCLLRVDRESLVHIVGAHGPPIFFNGGNIEAEQRPAPVVVSHPISTLSTWLFDQVPWTLIKRPLREMANFRSHQIWGSTWIIMNRLCAGSRCFHGFLSCASAGAWTCLDEFNRISIEVLSVVAQQVGQRVVTLVGLQLKSWDAGWNSSNRMENDWKTGHGATTHCVFLWVSNLSILEPAGRS